MDLNSLSNEELAKIAGIELPSQPMAAPAQPDYNSMSNEQLAQIAGIELPKPAQSGALLASNRLMAPLQGASYNFSDEAVAGAQTAIEGTTNVLGDYLVNPIRGIAGYEPISWDRGKGYSGNLEDINKDYAQYKEERPKEALALELAGAFTTPGAALKGTSALGKIAKLGAYGAAQGGLAGFGEGQGLDDRIDKAKTYAVMGGVLGGAIPAVAKGIGATYKGAKWLASPWVGNIGEEQAAKALQEITSADEIARIKAAPTDEVGAMRTLAEAAQSPQLAREQQRLMDVSGDAMNANAVNQTARNDALKQALTSVSDQPIREVAEAGDEVRRALAPIRQDWSEEIMNSAIAGDTLAIVPVKDIGKRAKQIIFDNYSSGAVPREVKAVARDLRKVIPGTDLKRFGYDKKTIQDLGPYTKDAKPYRFVDNLRVRLIDLQNKGVNQSNYALKNTATELKKILDDAVTQAGKVGSMTDDQVTRHFESNKKWTEYFNVYGDDKNLGAVTAKFGEKGDFTTSADMVVDRIWKGRRSDAIDILKGTRGDPEALGVIRGAIRDKILRTAFPAKADDLAVNKTLVNIAKMEEALTTEVDGVRLFEQDHVDAIKKVFQETEYLSAARKGQSALAKSSSKGQPTTAARLLAAEDGTLTGLLEKHANKIVNVIGGGAAVGTYNSDFSSGSMLGYGGAFLGALALKGRSSAISKAYRTALQKALIEDRDFAIKLLEKPTESSIGKAIEYLTPAAARIAPKAFGIESNDEPESQALQGGSLYQSATKTDQIPYNQEQKLLRSSDSPSQKSPLKDIAVKLSTKQDVKNFIDQQPKLIQAMIMQESNRNIHARSPKGAIGLMQLMPGTAKDLGVDPYDPLQNVEGGTRYIKQMFKQFQDPFLAMAAYNAGPGNVQRAIRQAGTRDWNVVQKFLKPETQQYIPGILKNLRKLETA